MSARENRIEATEKTNVNGRQFNKLTTEQLFDFVNNYNEEFHKDLKVTYGN